MRLHLNTTSNNTVVPFGYQQKLVGALHRWIGKENDIHDRISLYSFSWLQGAKVIKDGLTFPQGASFFISFYDDDYLRKIMKAILSDPAMFSGLTVKDITIEDTPYLQGRELFYCGSPILIKRKLNTGHVKQFTYEDAESNNWMEETLRTKMRNAGLPEDETLQIYFDTTYTKRKIKLVTYRGIGNKASLCPIIIHGKEETLHFAWNVGIGNSTGIGFGSIY
ncbi:CRISPR-associated protein, Cas6 family [Hallella multisaccharivorax DSM 17128]|uniref:CRISPR-associated protein, Cas6 family n=1 Tax=Hallella multisaccharivorax DSM 17128 TaxID=688246 RepID=F8N7X5_9BACT|nr:CRISPR-associated endoribonuclease Cas6 [Hallella multisaccharivorax]EGN57521.1 CRISPR-associated protein, Cas6 family [Hallella multisaccharivorax DSM 17128]